MPSALFYRTEIKHMTTLASQRIHIYCGLWSTLWLIAPYNNAAHTILYVWGSVFYFQVNTVFWPIQFMSLYHLTPITIRLPHTIVQSNLEHSIILFWNYRVTQIIQMLH